MRPMNKKQKTERCQEILRGGVRAVNDEDALWLLTDVFPNHPEWSKKQGVGVAQVKVGKVQPYNQVCFYLVRSDGTEVDISFHVSIRGRANHRNIVTAAARNETRQQVTNYKMESPQPWAGLHLDHVYPFSSIFSEWLDRVRLSTDEISTTSSEVGHQILFFDRGLGISWQRHHYKNAQYQWLTGEQNIAKSNKIGAADDKTT